MQPLPIDAFLPEICATLEKEQNLVLTAAPGAGKTTRLPPALLNITKGKILVLEPRRMAAIAAADRIAEENNWQLGNEIGYQVRFDNQVSASTRLIFMTEALLARQMLKDPELIDVDIVVLDEFHERSLHVDLTLGLIRELQQLGREIKIIVMSATLHAEKIALYLENAPVIDVPGKLFPMEVHYQKQAQSLQTNPNFYENLTSTLKIAQTQTKKDILVFLPGVGEIERAQQNLENWAIEKKILLVPLHGSLPLQEQRQALHHGSQQRIILSTNIAESSVTIDGVDTVIDSGLAKVMRQDHRTGFSRLEMGRISLSSATQRSGRSARQFPGHCYKLWSKHDELSMPKNEIAEIQRADLSEALLFLANQGVRDFSEFSWFEAPTTFAIQKAQTFLQQIGALNSQNDITNLGKKILSFPMHPRLAKILITSEDLKLSSLGADIAAIFQERDFLRREALSQYIGDQYECDITLRLKILNDFRIKKSSRDVIPATVKTALQVTEQLQKLMRITPDQLNKKFSPEDIRKLILHSSLDRLCRRRGATERGLMVGGRGVKLAPESLVKKSEFFVALSGAEIGSDSETVIRLACGFDKNFILNELKEQIVRKKDLYFDDEKGMLYGRESRFVFDLAIDDPTLSPPTAEQIQDFLPDLLAKKTTIARKINQQLDSLLTRISYLKQHSEFDFTLNDDELRAAFSMASVGAKSISEVCDKDLVYFFEQQLGVEKTKVIQQAVPQKIQVPSGSWIQVEYPEDREPYIEVRIQEVFGWTETPKILNKQKSITLHLLGPNYRPMQVTSDLKSFWQNGYPEVRKELRIKYPKHSWPEDPLTAQAEAKGRPRK